MKIRARMLAVAVAMLLTLTLPGTPPASAATLTVTDCGDTTPGGGPGQLRTLITAAASGDTIVVPACTITLTGAAGDDANLTGDLDINQSLTIQGAGAGQTILDGGGLDRVFEINPPGLAPSVVVTLAGLTIRNGSVSGADGGGIRVAGADGSSASLTVRDSVVTGNTTNGFGGGIRVNGSLTLINTTVSNNSATTTGGAGGGIDSSGTLTVTNSTISGNASSGTTLSESGGGIWQSGPSLTITGSTISGNSAAAASSGGGIFVGSGAAATLTNSTISGNSAPGTAPTGGGILHGGGNSVTVVNSTITGNTAANDGGLVVGSSGGFQLKNTIVADNTPQNCSVLGTGTIVSHNPNLDSGSTCGFSAAFGDLVNTDPMLGPLQNNGGRTPTHALLPGSPAIDAGNNAGCPATDQRGVPRPLEVTLGFTLCDIGAFEVETLGFIHASLALNTATVRPGTLLQGTVTVSNDGGAQPLDVYVALALPAAVGPGVGCPSGDAVAFLTGSGATLTCVSSGVQTFAPLLTNVSLPADLFTPISAPLFSLVWPAGAPLGPYTVAFVLTPAGAFSDGRVNPTAGIVLATAGFSATP